MKIKNCLWLFFILAPCLAQPPQRWIESYTCRHYGIREGLVQSQAFFTFQDAFGYMWFSTFYGISRFDGMHFDNYSDEDLQIDGRIGNFNQHGDTVCMVSNNSIVFMAPDGSIRTFPFPEDYRIMGWLNHPPVEGNYLYLFNCFRASQHGRDMQNQNIFSLLRFDLENKSYTILAADLPQLHPHVAEQKIYALSNSLIIDRKLHLYRLDNETPVIVHSLEMEENDFHVAFIQTSKNELFGSLVKGNSFEQEQTLHLCRYFIENDAIRQEYITQLSGNITTAIDNLDENRYIIGGRTENFILDMTRRSLAPLPLDTRTVNFTMVDRDGGIWISADDGVFKTTKNFRQYRLGLSRSDDIWSVVKDINNNVWFSSYSHGFWRADEDGALQRVYPTLNNKKFTNAHFGYMSAAVDRHGRIFKTLSHGIVMHDPRKGDPDHLELTPTEVSLAVYYDALTDAVFFGGNVEPHRTLNILRANGELSTIPFDMRHIITISRDGKKRLRIGTFRGEAWLDEENGVIVNDTLTRPYTSLVSMALDERGTLWKGSLEGLFAEDIHGNDRQINDWIIHFAVNYHNRYIIFGTTDKLHLLDLQVFHRDGDIQIRNFGLYDGYDVMENGQNGASIDHEGYVWVTGNDRALRFHPDQIMRTPVLLPRPPFLAAVYKADRDFEWHLAASSANMRFENHENSLRFDLLQASPSAPDKLIFRYRLNGFDDHWQTTRERKIIFQNLPFGKYRFEVQSSVDGGLQWSESVFSSNIAIRPPFMLSVPGLILIALIIAAIAFLIAYITRIIILQREEEKRKIDQLSLLAIRARFIPHFTGNVLNSINYMIQKDPHNAQKYISDFSDFSYMTLKNSDSMFRPVHEEMKYAKLYLGLEKLRFGERLEFEVTAEADVNMQLLVPCMSLQSFCENALKHGLNAKPKGGKIMVSIYRHGDFTVISVEDNGIGRQKARTQKSNGAGEGLKIISQQLEILNKNKLQKAYLQIVDLQDAGGQPAGTRVELWTPNLASPIVLFPPVSAMAP